MRQAELDGRTNTRRRVRAAAGCSNTRIGGAVGTRTVVPARIRDALVDVRLADRAAVPRHARARVSVGHDGDYAA